MTQSYRMTLLMLRLTVAGCATPGARPEDMSAAQHRRQADFESGTAEKHQGQYEATRTTRERCRGRIDAARVGVDFYDICWSSVTNPTESHLGEAEKYRRRAADHRAAAAALGETEERACSGVAPDDRDISPFEHHEDIAAVEPLTERVGTGKVPVPRTTGVVVTFRAVPGLTTEWLQRVVDCHLARNVSLGHEMPEMPNCPLVPKGAEARVSSTGNGFAVAIRSDDPISAAEILARATRLSHPPASTQ